MVTNTRRASSAPRKRTPSSKVRANQEPPPSKRVKRLPKGKKSAPPKEMDNPPSESLNEVEETPEDISEVEYTLVWCAMLGDIEIEGRVQA